MTPIENEKRPQPRVAVFGAGIAGLTAAHEFTRRGYKVAVYEANAKAGGFFRSERRQEDHDMPSEYSWHGMGPWYHNVFDIMKEIPFDETGSMYDKALSRPISFGLAPEQGKAAFDDTWLVNIKNMFRLTWTEVVRGSWLMFKTWTANRRTWEKYTQINAAEAWRQVLSEIPYKTWRSCFGPWIGSDWTNVSLHTAGQFFRKQLITRPSYDHQADAEGPAWKHGARSGWLLLRGPSNEYWFDRWVKYLEKSGVDFHWQQQLHKFDYEDNKITTAYLDSGATVKADVFVLATNPFAAAEIIARTPVLEKMEQLRLFRPLIQEGPHTQVSLRMAFAEKIAWPRKRAAIVVADSEFGLTLFAQEQVWDPQVSLGTGVQALLTITACVATVPGRLYGLPLIHCTREQFVDEVKAQLFACDGLNAMIREANDGRNLADFPILTIEVWHEWLFSPAGIQHHQPKWVNRTGNQQYLPAQATPVANLVLAGAHTQTDVDVWSIEAAVESGRRAAKVIEPQVKVLDQYKPRWLQWFWVVDDYLYKTSSPHVLFLFLGILLIMLLPGFFILL